MPDRARTKFMDFCSETLRCNQADTVMCQLRNEGCKSMCGRGRNMLDRPADV